VRRDGLCFDLRIPSGGYLWWYVDALSDDGEHGLTLIAFVGSVFSPYYAWARRHGGADPANHCAFNVALYGKRANRWTMTERGSAQLRTETSQLSIGPSDMRWSGDALEISVNEVCAPLPRRVRGNIRLLPSALCEKSYFLDPAGRHQWTPFAPRARIEVALSQPALSWSGDGYFDSNRGIEPLENAFSDWTWSRASASRRTVVLYDVNTRGAAAGSAEPRSLALRFSENGECESIELPPAAALPRTGWRVARQTRADAGHAVRVIKTLEDAPFYSRTLLDTQLLGLRGPAIHESLDLNRFRAGWVQCLLPFRMPRRVSRASR
jgi:carotenoid 1,2-hydratase